MNDRTKQTLLPPEESLNLIAVNEKLLKELISSLRQTVGYHQLPKLLNAADVADILNVSVATVYGLVGTGSLIAINVGLKKDKSRWRFRPSDVENYMRAKSTTGRRERFNANRAKRKLSKKLY